MIFLINTFLLKLGQSENTSFNIFILKTISFRIENAPKVFSTNFV